MRWLGITLQVILGVMFLFGVPRESRRVRLVRPALAPGTAAPDGLHHTDRLIATRDARLVFYL